MSSPQNKADVVTNQVDGAVSITMNRPHVLNAMTPPMLDGARRSVENAAIDSQVRVVMLTGEGRAFSSGADLSGRADPNHQGGPATIQALNRLVRAIKTCDKPVVVGVNGLAVGGGCSLAIAGDIVVAKSSAYLSMSFSNIGLMPDGGATALVSQSVGMVRAQRMMLLGERIPAELAVNWGLISHVVADDEYEATLSRIVAHFAAGPTQAFSRIKRALYESGSARLERAFAAELAGQAELSKTSDFEEAAAAFLGKRTPRFTGK